LRPFIWPVINSLRLILIVTIAAKKKEKTGDASGRFLKSFVRKGFGE